LPDGGYSNVTEIDVSEEQIECATTELGLNHVLQVDALAFLEAKVCAYDTVRLLDVLEHLELDQSVRLRSLVWAALRRRSVLVPQVPNALAPPAPNRHNDVTHQRPYTRHSILRSLLLGGFREADITCLEIAPYVRSAGSLLRWLAWTFVLRRMVAAFTLLAYAAELAGTYSASKLVVVKCSAPQLARAAPPVAAHAPRMQPCGSGGYAPGSP